MKFSTSIILALILSALCGPAEAQSPARSGKPQYMFVWAGAADSTQSDFLAVVDVTPRAPRYGDIIATVPVGAVTMAHHVAMADDGMLIANGFNTGTTYRFDVRNPRKPVLEGVLAVPDKLSHPHSFVRLPNGHLLGTYQYQAGNHGLPGGLAEHDTRGDVVRWQSAVDTAIQQFYRPYSLVTIPALDRIVTTGVDMHGQGQSRVVQVWKLSDLTLIKSLVLPDGQRGDEGLQSFEPRLLDDGRTVIVSTLKCGLYRIDGLDGESPSPVLIHTFDDERCDMPAVIGQFWVQTLSTKHAIVTLDISDTSRPAEVARLELGADNRPHWLAVEPGGTRLALTGYRDLQYRVLMLQFDSITGRVFIDHAFREEGSQEAGISFDRVHWPHGAGGRARPHGTLFGAR
ncbi:MAG: selenium-binding family protein [Acidobacteria bacterium]|nr:selenium-binding family protein [Acidobacteriota bacterium]